MENKKLINQNVTNSSIDRIYEHGIKNGAYGGRLLGAGACGYILFFHAPHKRNALCKALKEINAEVMPFEFEFGGTIIHPVKCKN